MIKFFRSIRQNLLAENRITRYLIYAIGEIILVVIGILIALQINNWNIKKLNHQQEVQYLQNIKNDISKDSALMKRFVFDRFDRKMKGLLLAKNYALGNVVIEDTIKFVDDVSYGAVFSIGLGFLTNNTFDELKSTGNLQLIRDDELKQMIQNYYHRQQAHVNEVENNVSGYANWTNGLKPYYRENDSYATPNEHRYYVEKMASEDLIAIANLEITNALSIKDFLSSIKTEGQNIIAKINETLNQ